MSIFLCFLKDLKHNTHHCSVVPHFYHATLLSTVYIFTFLSGFFIGLRHFAEDTFRRFDNIGVPETGLCVVDDTDPLSPLTKNR